MTLTDGARKRQRSCEDDEFMPISKKINNLRIQANSNEPADEDTSSSVGSCPDPGLGVPPHPGDMNGADNPHYGAINRLLYEAHLQRQQRMLVSNGCLHQQQQQQHSNHSNHHCPPPGPSQL